VTSGPSILAAFALAALTSTFLAAEAGQHREETAVFSGAIGRRGGTLTFAVRSDPKTFNPVLAADAPSRDVIWRTHGDLVHIDRDTQRTVPALASSWTMSPDGLHYTIRLRRGIRFSDGHPFDADDVLFSFQVYLDEAVQSPHRELLVVAGKPIGVRKIDQYTVAVDLSAPYAAAERLFDSIAMLPRHLLEPLRKAGRLAQAWGVATPASEIAGLGPFRLERYRPGEDVVLTRNPYYWKTDAAGTRLPYLDRVVVVFAPENVQVARIGTGEIDVINRVTARNVAELERNQAARNYVVGDLGPGLEYTFLFFNQNEPRNEELRAKQRWFGDKRFRRAVSLAIDRDSIVRLVYAGRATALWGHVTPGNRLWANSAIPRRPRSIAEAAATLEGAGFRRHGDALVDSARQRVAFSILVAAGNASLLDTATIIQDDLRQIGIQAQIAPLEFGALVDRVLQTHDYDACLLPLAGGDVDPNAEMNVWTSSGSTHVWRPRQTTPATPWEADVDRLMRQQLITLDPAERKRLYDRVQAIVADELPIIPLVSPDVVVARRAGLRNFRPAVLDHYTLWNLDELFWEPGESRSPR
jgi:peptide/nickel transport system substrate-binding protein